MKRSCARQHSASVESLGAADSGVEAKQKRLRSAAGSASNSGSASQLRMNSLRPRRAPLTCATFEIASRSATRSHGRVAVPQPAGSLLSAASVAGLRSQTDLIGARREPAADQVGDGADGDDADDEAQPPETHVAPVHVHEGARRQVERGKGHEAERRKEQKQMAVVGCQHEPAGIPKLPGQQRRLGDEGGSEDHIDDEDKRSGAEQHIGGSVGEGLHGLAHYARARSLAGLELCGHGGGRIPMGTRR